MYIGRPNVAGLSQNRGHGRRSLCPEIRKEAVSRRKQLASPTELRELFPGLSYNATGSFPKRVRPQPIFVAPLSGSREPADRSDDFPPARRSSDGVSGWRASRGRRPRPAGRAEEFGPVNLEGACWLFSTYVPPLNLGSGLRLSSPPGLDARLVIHQTDYCLLLKAPL